MADSTVRYTMGEMGQLLDHAETFVRPHNFVPIDIITRDKSHAYFNKILAGDGNIPFTKKDEYGRPKCPANGRLNGIWISAITKYWTKGPFPTSMYGPRRLSLPAKAIIIPTEHNLYFADFYRMASAPGKHHYITLVVTKKGSAADEFCLEHLPSLKIDDNKFFYIEQGQFYVRCQVYVELFYTEPLHLPSLLARPDVDPLHDVEDTYESYRRSKFPEKH